MTKKILKARESSYSHAPIYYADQPASLMLGSVVSRIGFGVVEQDDEEFPRPVVTIALPTGVLLEFVNDLKAAFDSPEFKKHAVDDLARTAKKIASGVVSTRSDRKIVRALSKKTPS